MQQAGPPASPARGRAAPGQSAPSYSIAALLKRQLSRVRSSHLLHRRGAELDSSPRPGALTYSIAAVLDWTALGAGAPTYCVAVVLNWTAPHSVRSLSSVALLEWGLGHRASVLQGQARTGQGRARGCLASPDSCTTVPE